MTNDILVGAIDLGGTKILSIILNHRFEVIARDERPTNAARGPDAVMDTMAASLATVRGQRPLSAVGISTPGPCDPKRGIVTEPPNLPGWHDVHLAELMGTKLGLPCLIENDANAAALAEYRIGAGKGSEHLIYVTLGTGIGGGLILDGRIYYGASGGAGEVGHMQLEPDGPLCGCGRRGCLEALASGIALGRDANAIALAEPGGLVAQIALREGVEPDGRILDLAADAGDALADAAIRRAGQYLGAGLTNLVDVFNPQVIVVGGRLRLLGDRYLGTARRVVEREAYRGHLADVRIVEAALGDEAPAIGAALIAGDRLAQS